jgi:hypothetical protein
MESDEEQIQFPGQGASLTIASAFAHGDVPQTTDAPYRFWFTKFRSLRSSTEDELRFFGVIRAFLPSRARTFGRTATVTAVSHSPNTLIE